LVSWAVAWLVFGGLRHAGAPVFLALGGGVLVSAIASLWGATRWRRVFMFGGFPLSLAASGAAGGLPAWAWLLPMLGLLALYPVRSWRDAPMFPTPRGALQGMAALAPLPPGSRILDAGCGLGDGLCELHLAYPQARVEGVEWSWPLRLAGSCRARLAGWPVTLRRGDLWAADWSAFEFVYLFQRPESMPRALAKAGRELRPGAWLASLEFEAAGVQPTAVHRCADGRPVWLYRAPLMPAR